MPTGYVLCISVIILTINNNIYDFNDKLMCLLLCLSD